MTNETISNDVSTLAPPLLESVDLPSEKRIGLIEKGLWIKYPLAQDLMNFLEDLDNQPRRPRMMGRALVGPTGNGKTSIIQQFIQYQLKKQNLDSNCKKYLYVPMPPNPTIKTLYIRILSACNFEIIRGTAEELWQKVLRGLNDLGVRMIFIDEIHNLLNSQNDRVLSQCRDVLKDISNSLMIPIVLIGTEKAEAVLKSDQQVLSRYPIIRLNQWKNNKAFRQLLSTFERGIRLRNPSHLEQPEIANRIYEISEGIIGGVAEIVTGCAIEAIKNGTEQITLELINTLHSSNFSRF